MTARRSLTLPPTANARPAIAAKGFRPFFLVGSAFAAAIVPLWLLVVFGRAPAGRYFAGPDWHAHEMVFGFALAVIAGFLLTAVGNWTQRETATGAPLLALAGLWVAGRVAVALGGALPRGVAAAVDLAFLPALMVALARPLFATKNRRNFVMLVILAALFAANLATHLDALGVASGWARRGSLAAVDVVVLLVTMIGGRVFPMFTRNATGDGSIRSHPRLDVLTIAGMAILVVVDLVAPDGTIAAVGAAAVGTCAAARAAHWGTRRTLRSPILWILHAGYAWGPLGLLFRAVTIVDPSIPRSLATHAWTVGAIGGLTLGMMARVALGHTGRPLVVAKPVAWAFVAINLAAIARVAGPLVHPSWYPAALLVAGALWTVAFLLFLAVYTPILVKPRVDGKPG
jgi:uncharacterized protein involved in response to NO